MPTVLYIQGWRLFFYSNEGNEPMRIHAVKGSRVQILAAPGGL